MMTITSIITTVYTYEATEEQRQRIERVAERHGVSLITAARMLQEAGELEFYDYIDESNTDETIMQVIDN